MYDCSFEIESHDVPTLVDCGTQCTVISEKFYSSLKILPKVTERVVLKTAEEDSGFVGKFIPKATLTFGNVNFSLSLYVGPIYDSPLLGLNFLLPTEAVIDLGKHTLTIKDNHGHEHTSAATIVSNAEQEHKVCRVMIDKCTVIPLQSKVLTTSKVEDIPDDWNDKDAILQPLHPLTKNCMMPYAVVIGNLTVPITLINPTDKYVIFKPKTPVANLVQPECVFELDDVPVQDDSTICVDKDPEHGKVPPLPKEVLFAERLKNSKELK